MPQPENPQSRHRQPLLVDGLIVSNWSRSLFEEMRDGGLTAANCTCSIWEDFVPSMQAIAQWKERFASNDDIITQVYTADDILRARKEGKVGIILGWQNSSGFGDDLRTVPLFAELGLRVVQMTYHTANFSGSGCLESVDRGLTDFGHDLVTTLNEQGILIDLSHVGSQTSQDVVHASKRPVTYTHCAPSALKEHRRNKSDDELREMADRGGLVGVTMFPPFMPRGNESTLADYVAVIEHVINICGEEQTAIGTDFMLDYPREQISYFLHDKGHGRKLLTPTGPVFPEAFKRVGQYPNLIAAMEQRGWSAERIERVLGSNWIRLFRAVWK